MILNHIRNYSQEELTDLLKEMKVPGFRSKQIFHWLHTKNVSNYQEMKNIPKKLQDQLEGLVAFKGLTIVKQLEDSKDGTNKFLFQLHDGHIIETVLMKYKYGYSLCISSQVGCRMGCDFCASTKNGLIRNLEAGEMLEQIYMVEKAMDIEIRSVVVMGTGEPLDNFDALIRFVELLSDPQGHNLSRRHITVSTCGLGKEMLEMAESIPQVNLALSLHSPYQEKRQEIMPIAKKYPLEELMTYCERYIEKTHRRLTFEYSLIAGVNDQVSDARALASLLKGLLCHVNLIPVNPVDGKDQKPTEDLQVERFKNELEKVKIQVTVRRTLGQEIDAACGQLRNRHMETLN